MSQRSDTPFYMNLREPIAATLRGAVDDIAVHELAGDSLRFVAVAGLLGMFRLVATVGDQICIAIERSSVHQAPANHWKLCYDCGQPVPNPTSGGVHRTCAERRSEQVARGEAL